MSETHERMWHEWYDGWHNADASKPKPSYEEWLEEHIRVLEVFVESLRGLREGCLSSYAGGYTRGGDDEKLRVFQHGMKTVCNVIDPRFKLLPENPAAASENK